MQWQKIRSISNSRWATYAAAGAATALACANSAEAEIHYSGPVDVRLTGHHHASLPLSNGASLVFQNSFLSYFYRKFYFLMRGVNSGSARGYFSTNTFRFRRFLINLPPGENVSDGEFLSVSRDPGHGVLFSGTDGSFAPSARGFIGFRFNIGNGTQYGWVRIQTRSDIHGQPVDTIKDYAWGDVGDTIMTGQTQSLRPANTSSVAGSLGLLAFGSQGLDAWRAQRTPASD